MGGGGGGSDRASVRGILPVRFNRGEVDLFADKCKPRPPSCVPSPSNPAASSSPSLPALSVVLNSSPSSSLPPVPVPVLV
jgi:hypothetical protein